ncbi:MAG: DNA-directed RNA polymerase subunit omega [Sedimentisphaerales bacterium]|nr:DNA-directed RNA polymerase subunit omega [Sedimentisphaerales bacterium]
MIEAFKSDAIVKKVGGKFRLTALIQRRLKELIEGARPLVHAQGKTLIEIAVQEIMEDKISVDYERTQNLEPPDTATLQTEIRQGVEDGNVT